MAMMRILKAAAVYFGIVFGVGFVIGSIRVPLIEPQVGVRIAQLIESPFMLLAVCLAGRWVGRRLCIGYSPLALLMVGLVAAALVLSADLVVGIGLRGMSLAEVFTNRDPVSGTVYYLLIAAYAVMPWLFGRRSEATRDTAIVGTAS
jgi:hypothetical protein